MGERNNMTRATTFTLVVFGLSLCVSAQQQPCQKAVAVAIASSTGVRPTTDTPHIQKFLKKNAKRYPDVCLSVMTFPLTPHISEYES
jgi:hypothetical protein